MQRINKPWGYELIWAHAAEYVGKKLYIKAGNRLSLQHHRVKEETILVLKGTLTLLIGSSSSLDLSTETVILNEGDSYHIAPGTVHRFIADKEDVVLIEVSTPELDDVIRHEDDYGRLDV